MQRPTLQEIYLRFARSLAKRSTCERLKVGCVITTPDFEQVLAIGYNGNAKGFANCCDRPEQKGNCGCIHAEPNALIKVAQKRRDKVAFVTAAPCINCAKLMINSGFSAVYYIDSYTYVEGLEALKQAGMFVEQLKIKDETHPCRKARS